MLYLGLALYAEGRTDDRFLGSLLRRLCGELCSASPHLVEFNDEILMLPDARELKHARRDERIVGAALQARGAWSILFVHADADGDALKARRERAQPALDLLHQEFDRNSCQCVAVVPVQCTEAWALCDGDALRQAFGTTLDDKALGLPASSKAIENLADPKHCLEAAFEASQTGVRRRPGRSVSERLHVLGEHVDLHRLRHLAAFQCLELELKQALRALRILD